MLAVDLLFNLAFVLIPYFIHSVDFDYSLLYQIDIKFIQIMYLKPQLDFNWHYIEFVLIINLKA